MGDHLVVEYVPKKDLMAQGLLTNRKDTFTDYEEDLFLRTFQQYFVLEESTSIPETDRTVYLFRRRLDASD